MINKNLNQLLSELIASRDRISEVINVVSQVVKDIQHSEGMRSIIDLENNVRDLNPVELHVLKKLKENKSMTRTDLIRLVQSRKVSAKDLDSILDSLFEKRLIVTDTYQSGKKPTTVFGPSKLL